MLTSHFSVVAKRAGFMDPVLLQELLVPSAAVQRVSKTQEFPAGESEIEDEQSVNTRAAQY